MLYGIFFFLHEALKGDHLLLYLCLPLIILLSLARVMPYFSNKFLRKKDLSNREKKLDNNNNNNNKNKTAN